LPHDSKPPKCSEYIDSHGEPVFIEHVFNCSRFWVCQPDLSDCLHECARADENGALYFDVTYQYPEGPVCDWPANIDCDNKSPDCGECEVWQECVEDGTNYICTPDCKIDPHCKDDEYCDFPEGGDGKCQKGCRNNEVCGKNVQPCGKCVNHVCDEPLCCTDADCPGKQHCIAGICDDECKTDDDCKPDEYCENGECLPGCNEDSDCKATSCSTCGSDHQCIDPECCSDSNCLPNEICSGGSCTEGCRKDSDCAANGVCAICGGDNKCTKPECCSDSDCKDPSKPICSDDFNCIPGCKSDEGCPGFDATCNLDYSNCNYCNITTNAKSGDCAPGCVDDKNCDGSKVCNGFHECSEAGSTKNLRQIVLNTATCKNCEGTAKEVGPVVYLQGGDSMSGMTECKTFSLDHADRVDFADGTQAVFVDITDKDVLGTCYRANLQGEVTGGTITWKAPKGEWSLKNNQVDFTWSDPQDCKYSCCLDQPVLKPNTKANLINCKKNCHDTLKC